MAGYRASVGKEHPSTIGCLNNFAWSLVQGKEFAEAETVLQGNVAVQIKKYPDAWKTFQAQSWLGAALLGLDKYDEAEPELLAAYQGMKLREAQMSDASRVHLLDSAQSLIDLYAARNSSGDAAKAEKWKSVLSSESKGSGQ